MTTKLDAVIEHTSPTGWVAYSIFGRGSSDNVHFLYSPSICQWASMKDADADIMEEIYEHESWARYTEYISCNWKVNIVPTETMIENRIKASKQTISWCEQEIELMKTQKLELYPHD